MNISIPRLRSIISKDHLMASVRFFSVFLLIAVIGWATVGKTILSPSVADAATSSTINFQARLLTSSGALVPDGYYNIEFKLYSASSGGTAQWTETYYDSNGVTAGNDNRVRVVNGYVSVYLGSQTSFPSSINWDQEQWLTMNVGGTTQTASPTWDGEMSPRLKLSAVPYAFKAGQLAKTTGSNTSTLDFATQTAANSILLPDESGTLCIQGSANCGFATGSGAAILQGGNSFGTGINVGTNDNYDLNFKTNGVTAATIQSNGDISFDSDTLFVDSSNNRVGIGTNTPSFDLDVQRNVAAGLVAINVTNSATDGISGVTLGNDSGDALAGIALHGSTSYLPNYLQVVNGIGGVYIAGSGGGDVILESGGNVQGFGDNISFTADNGDVTLEATGGSSNILIDGANVSLTSAGQLSLPVQGSGGGIVLGGDANLYRYDISGAIGLTSDYGYFAKGVNSGFAVIDSSDNLMSSLGSDGDIVSVGNGNVLNPDFWVDAGSKVRLSGDTHLLAHSASTGTTGTTSGTGSNTTTLTLTSDAFNVNDVVFIDNAGQDYYTRITVDPGTGSYTVSPAVTFENSRTVTKYTVQNLGATSSDYTTQSNRFFQGYFTGGIVAGAGSTYYSDGSITFQGDTNLYRGGADLLQTSDSFTAAGTITGNLFSGSGASLTSLNASNLSSGTVASGRISGSYTGITGTGALDAGSITSGFGSIDTGSDNITSSGTVQGGTVNATSALQVGGANINTAGTLSNVAYKNQSNTFSSAQTISASGATALNLSNTTGGTGITIGGDTSITRGAAGILEVNAEVYVGSHFHVNAGQAYEVSIYGSGSSPTIQLGADVTLSRGGADLLQTNDDFTSAGTVTGNLFSGSGASLTNLNASNISSGTLAIARGGSGATTSQGAINAISQLTTNGDLLYNDGTNSTRLARGTNGQCLTSTSTTLQWGSCGSGGISSLTLAASSGSSQTLSNGDTITIAAGSNITTTAGATDTVTVAVSSSPTFSGTVTANLFSGSGASITSLNGTNVSSGTVADARLSSNVALLDRSSQTFTGSSQLFKNTSNSTTAFRVQDSSSNTLFNVDTTNGAVSITGKTPASGNAATALTVTGANGLTASAGTNGGGLSFTAGTGGTGISTTGGNGGSISITAGDGGFYGSTQDAAGVGGDVNITAGQAGSGYVNGGSVKLNAYSTAFGGGGNIIMQTVSGAGSVLIGTSTASGKLTVVDSSNTDNNWTPALYASNATTSGDTSLVANIGNVGFAVQSSGTTYQTRYAQWDDGQDRWESSYAGSLVGPTLIESHYNGNYTFKSVPVQSLTVGQDLTSLFVNALTVNSGGIRVQSNASGTTGHIYFGTGTEYLSYSSAISGDYALTGDIGVGIGETVGCVYNGSFGVIAGTCSSDERLKENIHSIGDISDKFGNLDIVNFNWRQGSKYGASQALQTGVIAQSIEQIFPELVHTDEDGFKEVDYSSLFLYNVQATSELVVKTANQSNQITLLNTKTNRLKRSDQNINRQISAFAQQFDEINSEISSLQNSQNSFLQNGDSAVFASLNVSGNTAVDTITVTGDAVFEDDIAVAGHIKTKGDKPETGVKVAAGLDADVTIDGNDTAGTIKIKMGSEQIDSGELAEIIFAKQFDNVPRVILSAQDEQSINAKIFPAEKAKDKFMLETGQVLSANKTYTFDYFIVE